MPNGRLCSVEGCGKKVHAKDYCHAHYCRLLKHGDALAGISHAGWGEAQRFIKRAIQYDGDECLIWPFARQQKNGYAKVTIDGVTYLVHRIVYKEVHGEPPSEDHETAHGCGKGEEGCITPRHLRWATSQENKSDQLLHGTRLRGEKQNGAKLIEAQVRRIRELQNKFSGRTLAEMFGVSPALICHILDGKAWGWLT